MKKCRYSFLRNDSKIMERLNGVYDKDFTICFSECSKEIKLNRILADLLSPRIYKYHFIDGSSKEYYLNQNSSELDFLIISYIAEKLRVPTLDEVRKLDEKNQKLTNEGIQNDNSDNNNNDNNNENNQDNNYMDNNNMDNNNMDNNMDNNNMDNNAIDNNNSQDNGTVKKSKQGYLIKMLKLFKELGNEEVVKFLFNNEFKNLKMNRMYFNKIIQIEHLINETHNKKDNKEKYEEIKNNEYSVYKIVEYEEIKNYGAANFEEVKDYIMKYLSLFEIIEIFEADNFTIKNEYSLLKFIKEIILERGKEFSALIKYIEWQNLTVKEYEEYLGMNDPQQFEAKEWQSFIRNVMTYFKTNENKYKMLNITKGKEFKGIFHRLNKDCNGNCATKHIINVTSSSLLKGGLKEDFLFDYSSLKNGHVWSLNNELNGYLQIDFKDKRINLTHYTFHCQGVNTPKTWTIEGSNDLRSWYLFDSRKDDEYLKYGREEFHCYECSEKNTEKYRYIRIIQKGSDNFNSNSFNFYLSGIEFFGTIEIEKQKRNIRDKK